MKSETAHPERNVNAAVVELLVAVVLIDSFLWFGRKLFPGALVVFAIALLALTWRSHRRAGEGPRDIGFRGDTAVAAALWLVPVILAAAAMAIAVGHHLGSLHALSGAQAMSLVRFIASGMLQQYLLLGFFFRRGIETMKAPTIAAILTAAVFAALHAPNVFLTAVTFVAGLVSCAVYRRAPNLYVAGVAHGLLAFVLYAVLPASINGGMHVGIEYLQRLA